MDNELGRVVDALPGMVWCALADGRAEFLNRRWHEYTGRGRGESFDATWRAAIHPEDLPRWAERWRSAFASAEPWELELRLRRFDGVYRWFLFRANPLRDESSNILEWCGTNVDIEDRKRAEAELRRAYDRARSELARVARVTTASALTASIAHEVNQPLSGIITNASTCLRMLDATPPNVDGARETARRMLRDGNRASEVITRLRALFSRKEFTLESLDLNEAMREVVALSLSDLQRNRVVLQLDLADDLPKVTGDRVQLQQVILNLLRNALDAMAELRDRPRQLLIRTERQDGDHVRVTVRDAGVGVDRGSIEKLFDAFYTTKSEGMGVGLSVSRSIIESHHGHIWATPNEDSGATFAFSLPSGPMHSPTTARATTRA